MAHSGKNKMHLSKLGGVWGGRREGGGYQDKGEGGLDLYVFPGILKNPACVKPSSLKPEPRFCRGVPLPPAHGARDCPRVRRWAAESAPRHQPSNKARSGSVRRQPALPGHWGSSPASPRNSRLGSVSARTQHDGEANCKSG